MSDSCTFAGNVGSTPKLKNKGKNSSTSFSLALNSPPYTNRDGEEVTPPTHWILVTAFGELAKNICKSVKKGDHLVVMGRLNTFEDANLVDDEDRPIIRTSFRALEVGLSLRFNSATMDAKKNRRRDVDDIDDSDDYDDDDVETEETEEEEEVVVEEKPRAKRKTSARKTGTTAKRKSSNSRAPMF